MSFVPLQINLITVHDKQPCWVVIATGAPEIMYGRRLRNMQLLLRYFNPLKPKFI